MQKTGAAEKKSRSGPNRPSSLPQCAPRLRTHQTALSLIVILSMGLDGLDQPILFMEQVIHKKVSLIQHITIVSVYAGKRQRGLGYSGHVEDGTRAKS